MNGNKKNLIPYTQINSFFYIKDASKPIIFQAIDPSKVNPQPSGGTTEEDLKKTEEKIGNFMKTLKKTIKNL